jgi:hypothetical protein
MRKALIFMLLLCLPVFGKGDRRDDPSYQIDHNRTKNFTPTEHYLQENIDRVSDIFNGINFHEFYINEDLGDVTSKLIFGRTTGGNAEISYAGGSLFINRALDISTTNPRISLNTSYGYAGYLYSSRTSASKTDAYVGFLDADANWAYYHRTETGHVWKVNNADAMYLNASNQLGINTTTFIGAEKLRVNGNEYLDGELQIASTGKVISGSKALTDGSATGIFEVAIPSNTSAGGTVSYSIKCFDGTDLQNHTGLISFAGVNKAGTVTSDIDEVYLAASETAELTAGTLSDSWTITDGAGKITINLNANTSLTPTSMVLYYTITLNGNEVVTKL